MGKVIACRSCATKNRVPASASGTPRCARCKAALPWVVDASDSTFDDVVGKSPVPVVVDLWAPWCGPCRTVGPILEQLAGEFAGRMKLVKVNVDEAQRTSGRFDVRGVPTLLAMRGGREVGRQVGAEPVDRLRVWIDHLVQQAA